MHIPPLTRTLLVREVCIPDFVNDALEYLALLKKHGFALHVDEYYYALTLDETISNAVDHGNLHVPDKKVAVAIEMVKGRLQITVRDEGGGFDPDLVPDPCSPDCRLKRGGRGLHILRRLARVRWNREGNCIVVKL